MAITSHTIGFEGAQTIAQAEAAQVRLRAAVASGASLDIDLAAVTEADLAFVQLLVATRKSAAASGQGLRWRGGANEAVADALVRGGLAGSGLLEDLTAKGDTP